MIKLRIRTKERSKRKMSEEKNKIKTVTRAKSSEQGARTNTTLAKEEA